MNNKGTFATIIGILLVIVTVLVVLLLTIKPLMSLGKNIINTIMGVKETSEGVQLTLASDNTLVIGAGDEKIEVAAAPRTSTGDSVALGGASIAEKVALAAKEAGLSRSDAEIIMKMAALESHFRHCCQTAGKNKDATCTPTDDAFCEDDKILISYDGSSIGAMQLNKGAHPGWFSKGSCTGDAGDCTVKKNAGCEQGSAYGLDCNIRIGIRYLMALKYQWRKGGTYPCANCRQNDKSNPSYYCTKKTYTGMDAALLAYNGWGCDKAQENYVDAVKSQPKTDAMISLFNSALEKAYG
jgi:hypothetical protein